MACFRFSPVYFYWWIGLPGVLVDPSAPDLFSNGSFPGGPVALCFAGAGVLQRHRISRPYVADEANCGAPIRLPAGKASHFLGV